MKSQNKILRKRRAVSPVIATVILVAVTITVAVAVSYWMGGIASQYTAFEKVEIQTAYSISITGGWRIDLTLKNSGSTTATITHVFLNEKPCDNYGASAVSPTAGETSTDLVLADGVVLAAGVTKTIKVWIASGGTLSAGTTINLKLHSAGGMDYIKLVSLV